MKFTIPIAPQVKQRPRTGRGRVYTHEKTRQYESAIRKYTSQYPVMNGQLTLDATFVFKRPKRMPKSDGKRQPRQGVPDVDNLLKALCDGLQGSVVDNDSAFVELRGRKLYAAIDEPPCIEVVIKEYDALDTALQARALSPPKQRILESLEQGHNHEAAAQLAGVSRATYYRWRRLDTDFAAAVTAAVNRSEFNLFKHLQASADLKSDWRAYAWLLERRFPESYGNKQFVAVDSKGSTEVDPNIQEILDRIESYNEQAQKTAGAAGA
jgi:transposase